MNPIGLAKAAIACVLLAHLATCAMVPDGRGYRDQSAPIGVTSRYDDARFAGVWQVRGAYSLDAQVTGVQRLANGPNGTVWAVAGRACDASADCQEVTAYWPAEVGVPGADRLRDPAGGPERRAVVVWVDEGFRTAAVGDPDGGFAWVLDREPSGGGDRIKAARQILEFSGFDLSAMEMRP